MSSLLNDIGKYWLESRGRKREAPRYSFPDNEIITPGEVMRVSPLWNAVYLNLHPTHYAVAVAPDGKAMNLKGGYNFPLLDGRYTLHYIDKQNRISVIPRVSETTIDASQVSLKLVITYRVIDPIRALEVPRPVDTLIVFIQSDMKEFIRSHKYDEIVGDQEGHKIENELVARYIKEQHASRHQMSKLFFVADVVIEEKVGDPKITEIKESFRVRQRENTADSELFQQKQKLETKVAEQEAEIRRIKTQADAAQQEITQKMQLQGMELETARAKLRYRQEIMMRAMDAISQAFSTSTYPMDPREIEIIRELIGELMGKTGPILNTAAEQEDHPKSGKATASSTQKINELTNTLLLWTERKRS
jgi:hypothetical protein